MVIGLSGFQFGLLCAVVRFVYHESMITDRISRHEVSFPICGKITICEKKKSSQVMKERENLH